MSGVAKMGKAVFNAEGAGCATADPDIFFAEGSSHATRLLVKEAKEICGQCPIATACLLEAISQPHDFGVWGGATPEERGRLRRNRNRIPLHIANLKRGATNNERTMEVTT